MTFPSLRPTGSPRDGRRRSAWRRVLWGITASGLLLQLRAQSVLYTSPEPQPAPAPPLRPNSQANDATVPRARFPQPSPLSWGPLLVRPGLIARYLHAKGLQAGPGSAYDSSVWVFAPELQADLGRHWRMNYAPTWTEYGDSHFQDRVDQAVSLLGFTTYQDIRLRFSQTYATTSAPLIETAQQTEQTTAVTSLNLTYAPNEAMALESTLTLDIREADTFPRQRDWFASNLLHYRLAPDLDLAGGFTAGYTQLTPGADMPYVRPQARLQWDPTGRISVRLYAGFERRWFAGSRRPPLQKPIYGVRLNFQPAEFTHVAFDLDHTVAASLFADQIYENTQASVRLDQRLLQHLRFTAVAATNRAKYLSTAISAGPARSDRSYTYDLRLESTLRGRIVVALVYRKSRNRSSDSPYSFTSDQMGGELGYRF